MWQELNCCKAVAGSTQAASESVEFEAAAGAHRNGGGWQYDTRDSLRNTARDFLNMLCAPQILD